MEDAAMEMGKQKTFLKSNFCYDYRRQHLW